MDALWRLLFRVKTPKQAANNVDHVVRSNSFTVQFSPAFYENRRSTCSSDSDEITTTGQSLPPTAATTTGVTVPTLGLSGFTTTGLSTSGQLDPTTAEVSEPTPGRLVPSLEIISTSGQLVLAEQGPVVAISGASNHRVAPPGVENGCFGRENVRYIFSQPLSALGRPTCLKMLQEPLRDVYLPYVNKEGGSSVPCVIDVTDSGLRVQYAKYDGSDIVELFNEFHTIAYWAAVRCVIVNRSADETPTTTTSSSTGGLQIGFFPFTESGQCVMQEFSTDGFLQITDTQSNLLRTDHPPLFACVMRDGASMLKCHVFLCTRSQQAITLASKLYDSLKNNLSIKLRTSSTSNDVHVKDTKRQITPKKYATVICAKCKRRTAVGNKRRTTSFSKFLCRIRRLTINKDTKSPSNAQNSNKTLFSNPILLPPTSDLDLLSNVVDESDAGYHSIPQDRPQLAKLSMGTPHWMKILVDIGLKQHHTKQKSIGKSSRRMSTSLNDFFAERVTDNPLADRSHSLNRRSSVGGSTYAEIEELADGSRRCSTLDMDWSDEDDNLTERDSLESKSSWGRFHSTKVASQQVETINRMFKAVPSRAKSLNDLFIKSTSEAKPEVEWSKKKEAQEHYVNKDAEILATLQQLFQTKKSNCKCDNNGKLPNTQLSLNKSKTRHWGRSTFLP